jgi:hypothetical protein
VYLSDSNAFKGSAFNKLCSSLADSYFESPNDTTQVER